MGTARTEHTNKLLWFRLFLAQALCNTQALPPRANEMRGSNLPILRGDP